MKIKHVKMENSTNQVSVKTGEWILTFLISAIPVVGIYNAICLGFWEWYK